MVFKNLPTGQAIHKEITQRAAEFVFCAQNVAASKLRVEKLIRWERPQRGWFKLNTNCSLLGNPGMSGGGGILRNNAGLWVHAFSRHIRIATSFLAELWALRDGLIMCQNLQINALEIELDAKIIANLMNDSSNTNAVNSAMVADCRLLISQVPQVKVMHCYWETNRCVDGLARVGNKQLDADIMYYNAPPSLFA